MATLFDDYSNKEPNSGRERITIKAEVLKERFLDLYMHTCHVATTCKILGLVPRTFYHWKQNDKAFKDNFDVAEKVALMVLEDEAVRRAVYGTEKAVFQQGMLVGFVREYSDGLLIHLMKGRMKETYGTKAEITGAGGQPLLQDMVINHVHSTVPLAASEEELSTELELKESQYTITTHDAPQALPQLASNSSTSDSSTEDDDSLDLL